MCGRLACGLQPKEVCYSCTYKPLGNDSFTTPEWKEFHNLGKSYKSSYNISPTDVAPVLMPGSHLKFSSRIIAPMIFGVIPHWADAVSTKYSTINCRIETIVTSKLYGNLLRKGQRCAVICNGFYEWKKQSGNKKPYFIHSKQPDNVVIDDPATWNLEFSESNGYSGFRTMKLAALFEINQSDSEVTLSFTIITKPAGPEMSWLHDREPAILETEEQLDSWLNYQEVNAQQALTILTYKHSFIFLPVSNLVNKNSNKSIDCIKEDKESDKKTECKGSSSFLKNWLKSGEKRKTDDEQGTNSKISKHF